MYEKKFDLDPSFHPGYAAMQLNADRALEDEILEALTTARYLKIALHQIAKSYSVKFEEVEAVAQYLSKNILRQDIEEIEFNQTIQAIAKIEETITDPGLRSWKLQTIARKCKRSYRELMDCYNKALVNQAPVEPLNPAEFRLKAPTTQEWLIPGWLPKGSLLLLHGDGGTGKTLMGYQIIDCILNGKPWNGYAVEQGHCLLVQCDEPEIVLRSRLDLLQISDDAPLDILSDWTIEGIARLTAYLEAKRPAFVLIDSLSAINTNTFFSENDTEYARPILQLTKLCSQFGCTIVLIHHSNASGQARGTRAIHNSASEVWNLRVGESQNERVLTVNKTRLGRTPGSYRFQFDEDTLTFEYMGDCTDQEGASATQEEKIRLWMQQDDNRGRRFTSSEVAEFCAISKPATRRALAELWSRGVLKREAALGDKRGYVYWSPTRSDDEQNLKECDQKGGVIAFSDPVIASSDRISNPGAPTELARCDHAITEKTTTLDLKNAKSADRMIASPQDSSQESVSDAITDAIRGLTPDRNLQSVTNPDPPPITFPIKSWVEIIKSGMFYGKQARVKAVDGEMVTVENSEWVVDQTYHCSELKPFTRQRRRKAKS